MNKFYNELLKVHDLYHAHLDIITRNVYDSDDEEVWKDFMLFLKSVNKSEEFILQSVQMNYKHKFGD